MASAIQSVMSRNGCDGNGGGGYQYVGKWLWLLKYGYLGRQQ